MTFRAATSGGTANAITDTSVTTTLASTTPGDVNLMAFSTSNGTATAPTITVPDAKWVIPNGQSTVVDGSSPQLGFCVYERVFKTGDPTTEVWNFNAAANAVWACVAYPTNPDKPTTDAALAAFTGTGTTKTSPAITTQGDGIEVSIFGDRSGGGYSGGTGTERVAVAHSLAPAIYIQDSATNVAAGSGHSYTVVGPSTSVGGAATLRINAPVPVLANPLKAWFESTATDARRIAHRGGSAENGLTYGVEHSLKAYQSAVAADVQAMEVSVWRTSDGVWVCSHDRLTDRMFVPNGSNVSIDIPTNTWAAVQAACSSGTIVGNYPIIRLDTLLNTYGSPRIWMIENKQGSNNGLFCDFLDTYSGGKNRFIVKGPYNSTTAIMARSRGYAVWTYWYLADLASIDQYWMNADFLGYEYSQSDWTAILAAGLKIRDGVQRTIAHICLSAANVTTGMGRGAKGVMTGKVLGIIPAYGTVPGSADDFYGVGAVPYDAFLWDGTEYVPLDTVVL